MKIGFLLTSSPEYEDVNTVLKLSHAFLENHDEVAIFLADDAIFSLKNNSATSEMFKDLIEKGAEISICSQTATNRGLLAKDIITNINSSSLYSLAQIASESDRFLSFAR